MVPSRKPRSTLTDKQQRFVEEYTVDFNKTRAAIRAGYSDSGASRNIGYETYKHPLVQEALQKRFKELEINAEETTKLITDIAKGNLAEYFVTHKVEFTPKLEVPVSALIKQLEEEIAFEEDYAMNANFKGDKPGEAGRERRSHRAVIDALENRLLRAKMKLAKDPRATEIVNGKTVLIDRPELDIAKLVADKEKGRIKSVTPTEFGTKVELYGADTALFNLAKMQGLFAKDNAQQRPQTLIIDWTGNYNDTTPGQ